MIISVSWLSQLIKLTESPEELAEILTGIGLEVEGIENRGAAFRDIVVGYVKSCGPHPNADALTLCVVDGGCGDETVICGAPNVAEGQRVAFARVGAVVPRTGLRLQRKPIRGVVSSGMLCSSYELGLNDDHSGIMVLPESAKIGTPVAALLRRDDVVLQIGITPNRGDALSYLGVARDLSARLERPLRLPEIRTPETGNPPALPITIVDAALCPRYAGAVLRGITVGPSPEWLSASLENAGVRPINNVVDITNYVMLETGQPLHAFDLDKLAGPEIIVRPSSGSEHFVTLDERGHTLHDGSILICDAEKPVALGGIMGGLNSSISASTKSILLESACFNPSSIRFSARRVGISSESSYRFERGTDPEGVLRALTRAVDLIIETAGGTLTGLSDVHPKPEKPRVITLRCDYVERILGVRIDAERIASILRNLWFAVEASAGVLHCTVPTFRNDIEREVDVAEEIARIYGYDNIPTPEQITIHSSEPYDNEAFINSLRRAALALGFDEVVSSSLIERKQTAGEQAAEIIEVLNPVNAERPCLRPALLPSILENIERNIRNGAGSLRLFEIGNVFSTRVPCESAVFEDIRQEPRIAFAITGNAEERSWLNKERPFDFFDLKGLLSAFLEKMRLLDKMTMSIGVQQASSLAGLTIEIDGVACGHLTRISEQLSRLYSIEQSVYYAEFSVVALHKAPAGEIKYTPVRRYPEVRRDLAFLLKNDVTAGELLASVSAAGVRILNDVQLVDVFRHESFGSAMKSMAISLTFQASDRTLEDGEINAALTTIVNTVKSRVHAELREA